MAKAFKVNNPDSPVFTPTNTIEKKLLNYASLGENSNKYYRLEIQEGTGVYSHRVYTEYGRVGKTMVQEGRYFNSLWGARACFEEIISQKMGKGYCPVALEGDSWQSPVNKPRMDFNQIDDKVLQLIGKFYHEAIGFVTASVETPLGKISASQVSQGTMILDMIERALRQNCYNNFEELSNQFYSFIPVVFGSRSDKQKLIIDNYEKLMEKREMLDVMSSVAVAQENLQATIEEKYDSLGIMIQVADPEITARVRNMVVNSRGQNHRFKMDVLNVFEINNMTYYDQFNPYKVATMELFHGSRNCNMLGIMQHGLRIKPSAAVHTGSMFGEGIYFADQSTKSANYCWGFGGANQSLDANFLMICDVATGKIKEYTDAQYHLQSAPKGYNSVMGKKGSSLINACRTLVTLVVS